LSCRIWGREAAANPGSGLDIKISRLACGAISILRGTVIATVNAGIQMHPDRIPVYGMKCV
jgi:hypothetical protein